MLHDLRTAIRSLVREPAFTLVAIGTLALGIGANAAVFSVIRYLVLDSLAVDRPEELTLVYWSASMDLSISNVSGSSSTDPESGAIVLSNYSYPIYKELLSTADELGVPAAGFTFVREVSVRVGDRPAVLAGGLMADGRYFSTIGLGTTMGRPLDAGDDVVGAPPVAVISYAFWRSAFGADPDVIGRTMRVNGVTFEVVGVSASGFRGMSRGGFFPQTDVTVPLSMQPVVVSDWGNEGASGLLASRDRYWVRVVARVPETSRERVRGALTATLRSALPSEAMDLPILPDVRLREGGRGERAIAGGGVRFLYLLNGVAAVVLLIACMNLASLLLARGEARRREIAMRRALGATRGRLVRYLLVESLVIAFVGAVGGLLVTFASRGILTGVLSAGLGSFAFGTLRMEVQVDLALLAMTAGVATAAAVVFGLWPALRLSAADPGMHLKGRTVGAAGPKLSVGRALMALQIGVSVPLVVGAALLLRTLANIGGVSLGFDPQGIALFGLSPQYANIGEDEYPALYRDVMREVAAVPGVESVTLLENALMSGLSSSMRVTIDGELHNNVLMNAVGPGFFEAMDMRVVAGRAPDARDRQDTPAVAVVNQTAVRDLFGGASPIGRTVRVGTRDVEIVGVVADSRYRNQREEMRPILFDAALQRGGFGGHNVVVKFAGSLAPLEPAIRRAVSRVNGDLPVPELRTQTELVERAVARERVFAQVLTLFGLFGLLLASLGLHGVTSYSVTRRTNEIGVRVALGAEPRQVMWLILRQVLTLAAVGLAIGVPLTLGAGRVLEALLYGIAPNNPAVIGATALGLLLVAAAAGLRPARRAARVDPLGALRGE